jgi:hypothetical protein
MMDTLAPVTDAKVSLLVTFPLNENVGAGLGDGDGDVAVPLLLLQAHVETNVRTTTQLDNRTDTSPLARTCMSFEPA